MSTIPMLRIHDPKQKKKGWYYNYGPRHDLFLMTLSNYHGGLTVYEMASLSGQREDSTRRRTQEMARIGLIIPKGIRENTRGSKVWILSDEGSKIVESLQKSTEILSSQKEIESNVSNENQ